MAPKAKQQGQSSQPKAKAEPKAESQQPKAKAKAEPKAAAAEPPAAKAADPKAEAKAKAKAEAKAKAKASGESAEAAKVAAAADPKAKASAKQAAKSQGAAPPSSKAAAKGQAKAQPAPAATQSAPAAQGKSKAKGKAKAEPPPPEPEPVEEPEEVKKKKKTNHRGGRNKNKEETGEWPDEAPALPSVSVKAGKSNLDKAAANAEKDANLIALRQRFSGIDGAGSDAKTRKAELDNLIKDIEKELNDSGKKVKVASKLHASSAMLEQNLHDLGNMPNMTKEEREQMTETVKRELAEARNQELWTALKTKLQNLKGDVETKLANLIEATKAVPPKPKAKEEAKGKESASEPPKDLSDYREAGLLRRLGNLHKKDTAGAKLETKTLELDTSITKYLFTPPYILNGRFEQQYKVIVDTVRAAKGSGKGGKGAPPGKELTITGLTAEDVSECEKALKALDFSGMKTKEVENGLAMPSNNRKTEIEKEFNVFIFKNQTQFTIFGSSTNVDKTLYRIEDEGYCKTVTVSADLVKMIYDKKLQETWRASGVNVKIDQPPAVEGRGSQPAKITVQGKSRAETDQAAEKVEEFKNGTGSEVVRADAGVAGKLFERGNASWLAKRFREIQDSSSDFLMRKTPEGVMVMGPKKSLKKVQADLRDLLEKASYEPVKVTIDSDQVRVFTKDHIDKIREASGLMEMYKTPEKDDSGERIDVLVLVGEAASVEKAKAGIDEVLKNEGAVGEMTLSDPACKELLVNKGAKIQEIQAKYGTYVQVLRKQGSAKIFGSESGVEATKKVLAAFEKKADSIITKSITLEPDQIGRVIGTKGSTLNGIRKECNVEIKIDNAQPIVEMKGDAKGIQQAEQMIKEVLGQVPPSEAKPKAKPAAKPRNDDDDKPAPAPKAAAESKPLSAKAKANEGYQGNQTEDFPTLGGKAESKAKPAAKAWGKTTQAEASPPEKEEAPTEAYPELGGAKAKAATAPAAPAAAVEEEEEAGDCADPFEMMGGMGEEEVYKVTLMEEKGQAEEDA